MTDKIYYLADAPMTEALSTNEPAGYPDAIPVTVTETELVLLQQLERFAPGGSPLQRKLRGFQIQAFSKAHG